MKLNLPNTVHKWAVDLARTQGPKEVSRVKSEYRHFKKDFKKGRAIEKALAKHKK